MKPDSVSGNYQRHSSSNLVSRQPKLCNIFIFGVAHWIENKLHSEVESFSIRNFVTFPDIKCRIRTK